MKHNRRWLVLGLAVGLTVFSGIALNQTTTTTAPLVQLPDDPLYLNGSKAKANLTLALSVESPTVGTTFWGDFSETQTYLGYFDPMYCYVNTDTGVRTEYFVPADKKNRIDATCSTTGAFDGNFLNWATSSAIDILRYGLTGGNRVIDEGSNGGRTVLERAYLPAGFYNHPFFPAKQLAADQVRKRTPFTSSDTSGKLYIRNCRNRVLFASEDDPWGACDWPFFVSGSQSSKLLKFNAASGSPRYYNARVLVCDSTTATNRLMTYDAATKSWSGLCLRYADAQGNPFYKPVGQFQVNADNVRVAVFSYLNDNDIARNGGVMRAPLKYLGQRDYDANFNLLPGTNPHQEWDPVTGVLRTNPQKDHAVYGDQGYGQSGAINYINRFGTLNTAQLGVYKDFDPVSELYYEAFRYLQGKGPSAASISGLTGNASNDRTLAENFPVYRTWTDPFNGFKDNTGQGRSCARNSILAIADPFTHADRAIPGNKTERYGDGQVAADSSPPFDVEYWTRIVGSYEANLGLEYLGSDGNTHKASGIAANAPYRDDLKNIATDEFTVTGARGSYLMAGVAYFANTQVYRTDLPKARISTYAIDVNSYNASVSQPASVRRGFQLHLAAKYGGFDDIRGTGNPFEGNSNAGWQGSDGDARNYFLADSPQKFLDSISQVFASLVDETSSISGLATTTELRLDDGSAVFQGAFNPVAGYWSGRVRKIPLRTGTTVAASLWEAGEILTTRTKLDQGNDRRIVVGPSVGKQGDRAPTLLKWDDLASEHQNALNKTMAGTTDSLGADRVAFLRGDRRKEQNRSNPTAPFRERDMVLGTVVNAGLSFQGAPSTSTTGDGYAAFQAEHKNRTPVVFVAANDGMLHAFRSSDGAEVFAYIPGFVLPRLNALTDPGYAHRPMLDAPPVTGEAYVSGAWRSVLVGGAGGGAQGVYAIDVSNPDQFGTGNVLWEFTDADHPALGNVVGRPRIVRVRVENPSNQTRTYKWVAIVPGGVNNQQQDGHAKDDAAPSIFLLDLDARPSSSQPWKEGTNFWRIELPQASRSIATGVTELATVRLGGDGTLESIYAGDLQGNVWKLDFRNKGLADLGADALANLKTLNAMGANTSPLFVATNADGDRQPITSAPLLATGVNGSRMVVVGTGKYLEIPDTMVPVRPGNTLYVLPDGTAPIAGRSALMAATIDPSTKTLKTSGFVPTGGKGWYLDLNAAVGERQVSPLQLQRGLLAVDTLFPTGGACGEGGGYHYDIDLLKAQGTLRESDVGLLGGSFVVQSAPASVSKSNSSGRRTVTYTSSTGLHGAKGVSALGASTTTTLEVGRMSWREINREAP